jgi:hypothetical protein
MELVTAGVEIIKANGLIAHTHFISETRQLFETEEGSFVYKMDEQKIYKLKDGLSYTRLLLKLLRIQENAEFQTTIIT